MACCVQTAQEFIVNAFPVFIGALASEDAELICQKNNLSFVELIRPFCQLDGAVNIRDPVNPNIVIPVKNWKIRVIDIHAPLPPKVLINRVLSEVVSRSIPHVDLNSKQSIEQIINSSTHWYEAYRDVFFQLIPPMRHEFFRDFLACILIVSSKHPDPMHAFAALSSRQNAVQHSTDSKTTFKWFGNNTFKYYLLLHDVSDGEDKKAEAVFQSMKSVYGSHTCFLLQINSRDKVYPNAADEKMSFSDPWSQHIYPFSDETLDIDENEEVEKPSAAPVITNQKDADKKEEEIVNELENIEKQIEQNNVSPRSLTFNDPLTSMHYNEVLDDVDDYPVTKQQINFQQRPRKLSERSIKLQEYKKSLRQFSYSMVTQSGIQMQRKERGQCMTLMDQDKIKAFVYEFAVRGLLPHIEKLMRTISEQIIARKGIHKSLFHATKKWFGGNKPAAIGVGAGLSAGSSYHSDSPELQHRKLGDLAFLVQHYELAYNSYHSAKREFNNEHAWMYFAGALEMSAISSFMQGTSMYPVHYFEACISTYVNTCRMPDYATRACLMSTEALKTKSMYPEAAMEFIRLTNEDCDLRSALLLEQAAHCYLHNRPSMIRKYAFHMILAGHRYSKAAQRKHTLRCYINALQVYQDKDWKLAQDHVNFIIGRQSFNLGNLMDSQNSLKDLLTYESQQPPSQQASYLREYLAVYKQNLVSQENNKSKDLLPDLPLPKIQSDLTRCLLHFKDIIPPETPTSTPGSTSTSNRTRTVYAGSYTFQKNFSKTCLNRWAQLEKDIVLHASGDLPYPFKPYTPCLSNFTDNKVNPVLSQEEQFAFEIHFTNPLKIPLSLLQLVLLWELILDDEPNTVITNRDEEQQEYMFTEIIENFQLKPAEKRAACLRLKSHVAGQLKVIGVKYTLSSIGVTSSVDDYGKVEFNSYQEAALRNVGLTGMRTFQVKGTRLNSTKQERSLVQYGIDKRLEPHILPALPLLEVVMVDLPLTLLCGEIRTSYFTFKNIGKLPFHNLYLISNKLEHFSFGLEIDNTYQEINNGVEIQVNLKTVNKNIVKIPLPNNELQPDAEIKLPVQILGLDKIGVHEIDFLFYYEPVETIKKVTYRLLQQMIRIQTLATLNITSYTHKKESIDVSNQTGDNNDKCVKDSVLTLCIENKSQASSNPRCVEFSLKKLQSLSRRWKIQSLVQLPTDIDQLRPGETCLLHLKVTPLENPTDAVSISQIHLTNKENVQESTSCLDLFMKASHNTNELVNGLGLILYWQTFFIDEGFTRNSIYGQSHILPNVILNDDDVIEVQNEKTSQSSQAGVDIPSIANNGVVLHVDYPSILETDFQKNRLCRIPITIACLNETTSDVNIYFEADNSREESKSDVTLTKESKCFLQWTGQLNKSITVKSNHTESVILNAVVTEVGIFTFKNLNAYYLVNNEKQILTIPSSSFLSVRSCPK